MHFALTMSFGTGSASHKRVGQAQHTWSQIASLLLLAHRGALGAWEESGRGPGGIRDGYEKNLRLGEIREGSQRTRAGVREGSALERTQEGSTTTECQACVRLHFQSAAENGIGSHCCLQSMPGGHVCALLS